MTSGKCYLAYTAMLFCAFFGRCFGPNPTAPYAIPFVPSWRDEYVDKTLHNVLGPARRGYSPIFRLAETEAYRPRTACQASIKPLRYTASRNIDTRFA